MLQSNITASRAISVPPNRIKVELLINIEKFSCLSSSWKELLGFLNARLVVLNTSYNLFFWHELLWEALSLNLIHTNLIIVWLVCNKNKKLKIALKYTSNSNKKITEIHVNSILKYWIYLSQAILIRMRQIRDKKTQKVNALLSVHQLVRRAESKLGVLENQARTKTEGRGYWNNMFFTMMRS